MEKKPYKQNKSLFKRGNAMWQRRSKHGSDKIFATPRLLLESFEEYAHWCENNPLKESKAFVTSEGRGGGSSVETHDVPKMMAMTLAGFCVFMGTNTAYFRGFKQQLVPNANNTPELIADFTTVLRFIEDSMFQQKFAGAAAGLLKENIISRELGLADKSESTNVNFNSVQMTKDEIKDIAKHLDDEV